jgi:predicted transcriptional regulator
MITGELARGRATMDRPRITREAIQQYGKREEARESFKQEAEASWAEFQVTGMHLTGDETRAWLKAWGTDAETEVPPLHD